MATIGAAATYLRRFWTGEEIPRWLGLSLVAVYIGGLGLVAFTAVEQTQQAIIGQVEWTARHSVDLLANHLTDVSEDDLRAQQRALRDIADGLLHCEELRVVDRAGKVLASIRADEVGQTVTTSPGLGSRQPHRLEICDLPDSPGGEPRRLVSAPIGPGDSATRFLHSIVVLPRPQWDTAATRSWLLTIILASAGALLLLYRRLRTYLRGPCAIAENLVTFSDSLEKELTSLRLADELGAAAVGWNRLIDMAEELRGETLRSTASSELAAVLGRGVSGDLADALNTISDGILVASDGDRLAYANAMMVRILGITETEQPTGQALSALPLSALGQRIRDSIAECRSPRLDYLPRNKVIHHAPDDSSYRIRVAPIQAGHRSGVGVVVVSDISQQIRADKAREEFVSQVTHELRTPLTNIRAYAETLSSGMFDDPKVIADCYNVITTETRRLSRLIEDILSLSQLEVGTMTMAFDDVDLHRLLTESVRDLRGLAEEKALDLQLTLPAKLPTIQADRDKLSVVLNNLLGNALKYTPRSGQIRVECRMEEDQACISVKDTGIGIDPAEHERVFERFQRSSDPAVQKETGTGIGLTTAREIARCHGGDIELQSEKGKGATFILRIPATQPRATDARRDRPERLKVTSGG